MIKNNNIFSKKIFENPKKYFKAINSYKFELFSEKSILKKKSTKLIFLK